MYYFLQPSKQDKLGGYLLNDDKYKEELFIDKERYSLSSLVSKDNNNIYDMVNNISSMPFKINKDVLNYIHFKGVEQDLIIDTNTKHPFEMLDALKPHQKKKLAPFNSKKLLQ